MLTFASMDEILKYFPDLSDLQKSQFEKLGLLYKEWNQQINVISRKDIDNVYEHHLLHCMSIAKVCPFKPYTRILDLGTGGGLPGLPLAILFPEARFILVDSIGKKIKVVEALIEELELTNAVAMNSRAEKVDDFFDFVVCRAVARLDKLYQWSRPLLEKGDYNPLKNGLLCLKGGNVEEEIKEFKRKVKKFDLKDIYPTDYYEEKYILHVKI